VVIITSRHPEQACVFFVAASYTFSSFYSTMGKAGKARKRRRLNLQQTAAEAGTEGTGESVGSAVTASEVQAACKVLKALADDPSAFRGKEFKFLRASLHKLRQSEGAAMVLGFGTRDVSPIQVVSSAVSDNRWPDALEALDKMRSARMVPKLGAVCRWVRDCDATGDTDAGALVVLDSILRTADPSQTGVMSCAAALETLQAADGSMLKSTVARGGHVHMFPPWSFDTSDRKDPVGETMRQSQAQSSDAVTAW
jgi:hypothetical protein